MLTHTARLAEHEGPHEASLAPHPEQGLSAAQAAERLKSDGPNALPGGRKRGLWAIAAETLREPMFLLLLALYLPWASHALRFAPLPMPELASACGLGVLSVAWFEGVKWVRRRRASEATIASASLPLIAS